MKTLNKIIIAAAGISLITASYFAVNGLSRTIADESETATIIFDGINNSFINNNGNYKAYTSNNNAVDYTIMHSHLLVETSGKALFLQNTDGESNYYIMQFPYLKGIRSVRVHTSNKIVINATAYKYKTDVVVGHTSTDTAPTVFEYTFDIGDTISDLWKLSLTFKCTPNYTVSILYTEITYNVADCEALNY